MYHDVTKVFLRDSLKRDMAEFVAKCPNCQKVKVEYLKASGLLQEIQVPTWKWEYVNMDFVVGFLHTRRRYDYIWVVVDILTKSVHFISF